MYLILDDVNAIILSISRAPVLFQLSFLLLQSFSLRFFFAGIFHGPWSERIWLPSALSRSELIWVWMLAPAGKMRPASQTGAKWFPKYDDLSSVHDLAATWMQMWYHRFSYSLESAGSVLLRGLRFYLSTKSPDSRLAYGENTILALNKNESWPFPILSKTNKSPSESLISHSQELLKCIIARWSSKTCSGTRDTIMRVLTVETENETLLPTLVFFCESPLGSDSLRHCHRLGFCDRALNWASIFMLRETLQRQVVLRVGLIQFTECCL